MFGLLALRHNIISNVLTTKFNVLYTASINLTFSQQNILYTASINPMFSQQMFLYTASLNPMLLSHHYALVCIMCAICWHSKPAVYLTKGKHHKTLLGQYQHHTKPCTWWLQWEGGKWKKTKHPHWCNQNAALKHTPHLYTVVMVKYIVLVMMYCML